MKISNDGVEVQGADDAPPVVFLHGVTGSARTWEWLPPQVTDGRRIIRVDFRGHGRSDHAPGTYDVPHYGADVVAVVRELSPDRPAVLVGHSLGATVAWWLAQNHPEMVAATFLEDPPLLQGPMDAPENEQTRARFQFMRRAILADRQAGRSEAQVAERTAAMPTGQAPDAPTLGESVCDGVVPGMAAAHREMDMGVLDGAIDGSTLAALDTESPVTPPVYILRADEAQWAALTTRAAQELAQRYPGLEIAQAVGSGHGIHDERRQRPIFLEHLTRFLDQHAPVSAASAPHA